MEDVTSNTTRGWPGNRIKERFEFEYIKKTLHAHFIVK